jgi:murein DD-endopeptidase MepM/ murein hydrolase activator NlpD
MSLARPVAWLLPLVVWASLVALSPAAVAEADPVGVWPLQPEPQVLRGFDPPDVVWGAGHRGVDLLGSSGQAVHAALAGTVTFAGMIAGRGVVVVDHGDTRTTYEPVASSVDVGAQVAQGAVIGTLASAFSHCPPLVCLHWGWLRGETYLDPLGLVGAGPVRLLPLWRDDPVAPGLVVSARWPALAWPSPYAAILLRLAELARPPPGALAGAQARGCACW